LTIILAARIIGLRGSGAQRHAAIAAATAKKSEETDS
jgi:hypothetical protein